MGDYVAPMNDMKSVMNELSGLEDVTGDGQGLKRLDGHRFLVSRARDVAPVVKAFRSDGSRRPL